MPAIPASVIVMNEEEIEIWYNEEVDKATKEYIENSRNKQFKRNPEVVFKQRLLKSIDKYNELCNKFLEDLKKDKGIIIKIDNFFKKTSFNVKRSKQNSQKYIQGIIENAKTKLKEKNEKRKDSSDMVKFKTDIKLTNALEKLHLKYPIYLIKRFIKTKRIQTKKILTKVFNFISKIFNIVVEFIKKVINKIRVFIKMVIKKVNNKVKKVKDNIKKKTEDRKKRKEEEAKKRGEEKKKQEEAAKESKEKSEIKLEIKTDNKEIKEETKADNKGNTEIKEKVNEEKKEIAITTKDSVKDTRDVKDVKDFKDVKEEPEEEMAKKIIQKMQDDHIKKQEEVKKTKEKNK